LVITVPTVISGTGLIGRFIGSPTRPLLDRITLLVEVLRRTVVLVLHLTSGAHLLRIIRHCIGRTTDQTPSKNTGIIRRQRVQVSDRLRLGGSSDVRGFVSGQIG
jgi:hypothetical protein